MLLPVGKEEAEVSPRLMGAGQNVGHGVGRASAPLERGQNRSSPSPQPSQEPLQAGKVWNYPSQCVLGHWQQGRCLHPAPSPNGAISTAALWIYVKTLCMRPCNDFRREVHLIFIRCLRLWFYKLMEHVSAKAPKQSFRSYWQMYCFQRPCVENLCSTLCFVPSEITWFLLDSIITNYLMRCDLTKTKQVHSKVSKEEDIFHARTAPRFEGLGTSKVSSHALKENQCNQVNYKAIPSHFQDNYSSWCVSN